MRRVAFAALGAMALLIGSIGAVTAAPSPNANCIAKVADSFEPGSLGHELSPQAQGSGLGWLVGGNGSGLAPVDPPDCG